MAQGLIAALITPSFAACRTDAERGAVLAHAGYPIAHITRDMMAVATEQRAEWLGALAQGLPVLPFVRKALKQAQELDGAKPGDYHDGEGKGHEDHNED